MYSQPHTLNSALTFFGYARRSMISSQALFPAFAVVLVLVAIRLVTDARTNRNGEADSNGLRTRNGLIDRTNAGVMVTVALIAGGQLGFYSGAPFTGRYLYPIAFAPALAWGVIARITEHLSTTANAGVLKRFAPWLVPLLLVLPIVKGYSNARAQIEFSDRRDRAFQLGLATIVSAAEASHAKSIVIQPQEPWLDMERTLAMARYLNTETGLPIMTLPATRPGTGIQQHLAEVMESWSTNGTSRIAPYVRSEDCLSVVFGENTPVCPDSVPPADSGY